MQKAEIVEAMARAKRVVALLRCHECFDDGQDTDVGRAMLDELTVAGWLEQCRPSKWRLSASGQAIIDICNLIPGGEAALMALVNGEAVMVPTEPTDEMRWRGRDIGNLGHHLNAFHDDDGNPDAELLDGASRAIYRAMLATSPYAAKEGRDA